MPTVALSVPAIARVHRPRPRTTARGRAPIRVARASAAGAPDKASAGGGASSSESDALRKCAIAFVDRHVSSGDRVGIHLATAGIFSRVPGLLSKYSERICPKITWQLCTPVPTRS